MARHLLFTSSREGVTEADVGAALRPLFAPDKILVSGGARGGDRIAARLWREWGGQVDEHPVRPVEWQRSRSAGYRRNAEMVAKVKAASDAECVALIARCASPKCPRTGPHGTHGAVHCAGLAEEAGLPVTRVKAGAQPERDIGAREALHRGGIAAAELEADDQIKTETAAWAEWNRAVFARAAADQQLQEGAQEMFGRSHRAEARQQTEADRLFAEADQLAELTERPDHQREIAPERAARIRERIGEDLVHDARIQADAPEVALTGGDLDAEIDRLTEMYPEGYEADQVEDFEMEDYPADFTGEPFGGDPLPDHVTELEPGAFLIEAPVISEPEHAAARDEFLEWLAGGRREADREHLTTARGAALDAEIARQAEVFPEYAPHEFVPWPDRAEPGAGRRGAELESADRQIEVDRLAAELWPEHAMPERDREPLPRVLEPGESAAPAPDPTQLPDGTPHPNPLLAEHGWATHGGWYTHEPEHQLEAG